MLADLVSVQCAAIGLCCSEEFKKSKPKPLLAQLFMFSISEGWHIHIFSYLLERIIVHHL